MGKKRKLRSFARRLTRRIAITQFVVMALASYLMFKIVVIVIEEEECELYESYLKASYNDIGSVLSTVSTGTVNHAWEIEQSLDQPDRLYDVMRQIVTANPCIHSCGISFIADYYPQKGHTFCPYAYRDADGQVVVRASDNSQRDYLQEEWFVKALEAHDAYWSEPFYASDDSLMSLVAYLVPIHDRQGRTVAVLGSDMSLKWFSDCLKKNITVRGDTVQINYWEGKDKRRSDSKEEKNFRDFRSYYFIVDSTGTFIAHPDSSYIIRKNFLELAKETPDTCDDYLCRLMVEGERGVYSDSTGKTRPLSLFGDDGSVYLFYRPIEATNWSIALAAPRFLIDGMAIGFGVVLLVLIGISMLVVRLCGRFIVKRATRPLKQLADSANEVAKGNFYAQLPQIKHNDEIRLLRDSFDGMLHSLTEYVEELKETTASKAAIENELKVAHGIQMSMLPKTFPPYPERNDIDVYGSLTAAKDVGGDLFDFYIRDEKLFFCIGDVSGKGVPASLVMAVTRSLFRNISAHTAEPEQIVATLNDSLVDGNETNMFVTVFIGVLNLADGELRYCNAGHDAPLLISKTVDLLQCDSNLALGVMPDWIFTAQQIILEPQTMLFLYTDGLNEAEAVDHSQFGVQRIKDVALQTTMRGENETVQLIRRMTDAVHAFVGEAEQSDDLTMLAIKYMKKNG